MKYDIVLVGAGITNATIAALNPGKKILVLERGQVGGSCRTEYIHGTHTNLYGPHVFHTNNKFVWEFVQRFGEFVHYRHRVKASVNGEIVAFPVNLNTLQSMYRIETPEAAHKYLSHASISYNFREHMEGRIGASLFNSLFRYYYERMYGVSVDLLPAYMSRIIPVRTNFNDDYYDDKYQGLPIRGYTSLIENMFSQCDIQHVDFLSDKEYIERHSKVVVYTGAIDEYHDYQFGELQYRHMEYLKHEELIDDVQGIAVIHHCDGGIDHTRTIEYKNFLGGKDGYTLVGTEIPEMFNRHMGHKRLMSVPTESNMELYRRYEGIPSKCIFSGSIGSYRNKSMGECIMDAINIHDTFLS